MRETGLHLRYAEDNGVITSLLEGAQLLVDMGLSLVLAGALAARG